MGDITLKNVFLFLVILLTTCSVVLAGGSTRLQIDIVKSSSLPFHMLFSSELLRQTKVGFSASLSDAQTTCT